MAAVLLVLLLAGAAAQEREGTDGFYFAEPVIVEQEAFEQIQMEDKQLARERVFRHRQMAVVLPEGMTDRTVTWEVDDPSLARIDAQGRLTHLADGVVTVTADAGGQTRTLEVELQSDEGFLYYRGGVARSLRRQIEERMLRRIQGKDPATAMPLFIDAEQGWTGRWYRPPEHELRHQAYERTVIRNPDAWAADVDMTSLSVWNSTELNRRGGVAITPRHLVFAAHYRIATGATVVFLDQNSQPVTRTIARQVQPVALRQYPDQGPADHDISLAELDEDLPATITPARLLPLNWRAYLPDPVLFLPVMAVDQEKIAQIAYLEAFRSGLGHDEFTVRNWSETTRWLHGRARSLWPEEAEDIRFPDPPFLPFAGVRRDKDSGHPAFLIHGRVPTLLLTWMVPITGPVYGRYIDAINAQLAEWESPHRVQTADFR